MPKKPLFIALGILGIGVVAFLIADPILSEHFKIVYPKLEVNFPKNFSTEKALTLTGSVIAECNCDLNLTINEKKVSVGPEGVFEYSLPISDTDNEKRISLQAQARGVFWNNSTQTNIRTETIRRASTPISIDAPEQSSGTSNNITITSIPAAKVSVTGYFHRDIENKEVSPSTQPVTVVTNDSGEAKVTLPFENSPFTTKATYRFKVEVPHYLPSEQVITIENSAYDQAQVEKEEERQRIAQEENAKREAEAREVARKKSVADNMKVYEGNGSIMIAIANNGIQKSRTIGYYYVNDPANYQYIKVPVFAKNVGFTTQHVNSLYFSIIDSSGRTYNVDTATYSLGNGFEATNLQPGTNIDGWLAFIVPKSEQELTLVYSDGFSGVIRKEIIVQ